MASEERQPLPPRVAYALATATGFLYFLAFPGIDVWPLGFVALVPLIVALRGQTPRRAAGLGWAAGFTMTMAGFYWLLDMLKTFSGFPTPVCFLFMCILCGYQGGRIALLTWIAGRGTVRGWPRGLTFCLGFIASELTYPLLFPWYYGATVYQIPALTQVAELGNPIVVGLVLVAANYAVAEFVEARLSKRAPRLRLVGALVLVPVLSAIYGVIRIHSVDARVAAAPKAHVGVVQANMSLMGKRHDKMEGLRRHMDLTQSLIAQGPVDLVVWSETSVMSAVDENDAAREYPLRFTRALGVPTVFGSVLVREVPDERHYVLFNSALLADKSGEIRGRYDKTYLLAFGEYLPFGDVFPVLYDWSPNTGKFAKGTSVSALPLGEHKLNVHICYEDVIPSFLNRMVQSDPGELLVNMTNDAWFGDSTEPWIHLALATFRSIEHRRFLVRSTNSGTSGIVDPVGRIVQHTHNFQREAMRGEIAWLDSKTPYEIWGDIPWWLATLAAVFVSFVYRRKLA
jgi:apolipoprotein N-acyltransferase